MTKRLLSSAAALSVGVAILAGTAVAQSMRDQVRVVGSSTVFPYSQAVADAGSAIGSNLDGLRHAAGKFLKEAANHVLPPSAADMLDASDAEDRAKPRETAGGKKQRAASGPEAVSKH